MKYFAEVSQLNDHFLLNIGETVCLETLLSKLFSEFSEIAVNESNLSRLKFWIIHLSFLQ